MKADWDAYKARGICPCCGAYEVAEGHTMCAICLFERREKVWEARSLRRQQGKCPRCGKPLMDDSPHKVCPDCYAKEKKFSQTRRERLKKEGICVVCGKKAAAHGKLRCERCLIKAVEYTKKCKEARKDARRSASENI